MAKTVYTWVNTKHPEDDLVYATSFDSTLELEKIEVQVEEGQSVIEAVKNKIQEIKGEI